MNWWIKFGCFLTGWNVELLKQCSESSRRQLKKYASALLILMIIWGTTGYCFADRYVALPWWGCLCCSLVFTTIVIQIERQIILASSKSKRALIFRVAIAVIMAMVGSTILDQTIFGKDIEKQLASNIEDQVNVLMEKRVHIINDKLTSLHTEIDSLNIVCANLQDDVIRNPFVEQTNVSNTTQKIILSDGTTRNSPSKTITKVQVPNPKQELLTANRKTLDTYKLQEQNWTEKKQTLEDDIRAECKNSVGFLEELEAMWEIVSSRLVAALFYGMLWLLLMALELFVAFSKYERDVCDYELFIKNMQKAKELQIQNMLSRNNSYINQ